MSKQETTEISELESSEETDDFPVDTVYLRNSDSVEFRQTGTLEEEIEKWVNLMKNPRTIIVWKVEDHAKIFPVFEISKVVIGKDPGYDYLCEPNPTPKVPLSRLHRFKHWLTEVMRGGKS